MKNYIFLCVLVSLISAQVLSNSLDDDQKEKTIKKVDINYAECQAKAKSLGFSIDYDHKLGAHVLKHKENKVADDLFASYYEEDDDYFHYDRLAIFVVGDKVVVRGRLNEIGADRPGRSIHGERA